MNKKAILGVLVILMAAGTAFGRNYTLDEQADVDLSGVSEVVFDLRTPNCTLCIRTMDVESEISGNSLRGNLNLSLKGKVSSNRDNAVPSLIVDEGGNRVTIRLYRERKTYFGLNQGGTAVFTAEVPESFTGRITVTGDSNDMYVRDFRLEAMDVRSSSGDVDAENIEAREISIDLSSGKLRADNLAAERTLALEASSGDLDLGTLSAGDMTVEASSGDIGITSAVSRNRMTIKASSGTISVGNLEAATAEVDSSSGRITLGTSVTEAVTVEASSGDVVLEDIESGTVNVKLSSGDLTVRELRADRTEVKTTGDIKMESAAGGIRVDGSSGKVEIEMSVLEDDLDIDVSSGDITLTLPGDSTFDADLSTSSGKVRSEFTIMGDVSSEGRGVNGSVNGGGRRVRADTSSGDIRLLVR